MSARFGSTGMIAAAMVAAIGFYTLSLHVSAQRAGVERLQARIASDLKDIRALEAELRTRARLPVLQKWNDEVLAMSAPTSKQFVGSPVQLAAFAPGGSAPAAASEPTMQLALATEEEAAVRKPMIVKASYEVPTVQWAAYVPAPVPAERSARPGTVGVKVQSPGATAKTAKAEAKPGASTKLTETKAKAAKPMLAGLDSLAGVIDSAAAAERSGFRKVAMQ